MEKAEINKSLKKAVLFVGIANFFYFFIEFFIARKIASVSLFADSIDFLEDASVNFLIVFALGWSLKLRSKIGFLLAIILLVPALATFWAIWHKISDANNFVPDAFFLSSTGCGALLVNVICALVLAKYKNHKGSLTKAAFLSARNDAIANIAIILAGLLTFKTASILPDLIVGIGIGLMNLDAAKEVWEAAKNEHNEIEAEA